MSLFPKIARPCPYVDRLDTVMDGDFCTMCKRDVYDLTDMDEGERRTFLADCGGKACVRYTVLVKPALAAAALATAGGAMSGFAAVVTPPPEERQLIAGEIPTPVYVPPLSEEQQVKPPGTVKRPRSVPPVEVPMIAMVTAGIPLPPEPVSMEIVTGEPVPENTAMSIDDASAE